MSEGDSFQRLLVGLATEWLLALRSTDWKSQPSRSQIPMRAR